MWIDRALLIQEEYSPEEWNSFKICLCIDITYSFKYIFEYNIPEYIVNQFINKYINLYKICYRLGLIDNRSKYHYLVGQICGKIHDGKYIICG